MLILQFVIAVWAVLGAMSIAVVFYCTYGTLIGSKLTWLDYIFHFILWPMSLCLLLGALRRHYKSYR